MTNTIKKVVILVLVFITSCHVTEKWNKGPVSAHIITAASAVIKAADVPVKLETLVENLSKIFGAFLLPVILLIYLVSG